MKKLLLICLIFFAIFVATPHISHAQEAASPPASSTRTLPMNTNPDVPQNFHTYTQNVFIEILATAVCFTSGIDILTTDGRCLGVDPVTKKIGYADTEGSGLIAMMGNLIGATYNLPASTGTYTHYLAGNFGITRSSVAQAPDICDTPSDDPLVNQACIDRDARDSTGSLGRGIGYDGLTPILNIWKAFRNLTYLFFVIVFVVLGLGIMFRLNIDARTVMTIQNQIPKIILALILITFSYAIAGFLIDLMYLSIYLVVHVFDSQKLATVRNMSNPFTAISGLGGINNIANPISDSVVSVFASIFDGGHGKSIARIVTTIMGVFLGEKAGGGIGGMIGAITGGTLGTIIAPGVGTGAGLTAGAAIGKIAGGLIGGAIGATKGPEILQFVAGIIIYIVIVIAIFRALLMTWIALIKAYVFILIDVIFAPVFIIGGLVPGATTGGFTAWIRSLLGNLAAFPTVLILFMIGSSIQSQIPNNSATGNFVPPLVGGLGDGTGEMVAGIIGLGIILIMPESVNLAKAFFKAPERKLAQAAMAPIGVGAGAITKPFKNAIGSVWGEDKHTGHPKWLTRKIRGMGTIPGAMITGGTGVPDPNGSGKLVSPSNKLRIPGFGPNSKLWAKNRGPKP